MANSNIVKPRKFSCIKWFITLFLIYFICNILYGNFLKYTFTYEHNGKKVYSVSYPRKYHAKFDGKDRLIIQKKCSIFEMPIDCGYDMSFTLTSYWKGENSTFSTTPEEYFQKNNFQPEQCTYEDIGGKQVCFHGYKNTNGLIFDPQYRITMYRNITSSNRASDVDRMLKSIKFY